MLGSVKVRLVMTDHNANKQVHVLMKSKTLLLSDGKRVLASMALCRPFATVFVFPGRKIYFV